MDRKRLEALKANLTTNFWKGGPIHMKKIEAEDAENKKEVTKKEKLDPLQHYMIHKKPKQQCEVSEAKIFKKL